MVLGAADHESRFSVIPKKAHICEWYFWIEAHSIGYRNCICGLFVLYAYDSMDIVQGAAIRFEFRGGEWKEAFLQMDGEPWKQPMSKDYSTFVEIKKVPFQSVMINGD